MVDAVRLMMDSLDDHGIQEIESLAMIKENVPESKRFFSNSFSFFFGAAAARLA